MLLLVISVAVVVAVVWFFNQEENSRGRIDAQTLCPETGPVSVDIVLVDQTDTLNARQRAYVLNRLLELKDDVPKGGALQFFAIKADRSDVLKPVFTICNPGRGGEANPLVESQRRVETEWKERFEQPTLAVLSEVISPSEADISPIMEAIQSVAISTLNRKSVQGTPRTLTVVSDLLHNTPEFSQYQSQQTFSGFMNTRYFARVRTNLANTKVQILYVPRESASGIQGKRHALFWTEYFVEQGASDVRISRVEG